MKTELENAIKATATKAADTMNDGNEAMKFTQACVNVCNALCIWEDISDRRKK